MFGLAEPQALRQLAVARGCTHYQNVDDTSGPLNPGAERLSNLELAIAMVSGAQEFEPTLIRCAAQLLSGEDIDVEKLARMAVQERAAPVIRHIARAAAEMDTGRETRWRKLLSLLPKVPKASEGCLSHRSRFVTQTGLLRINGRLQRTAVSRWLSPIKTNT